MSAVSGALGGPQQDLEDLQSLGPLGVHSVTCCTLSPIFMHSLGDVWHLGSEDLESLQLLGPSLQDLQDLQSLGPLGVHSVICCTLSSYLYAFLRWRLASWLWGSGVSAASGSLSARSGGSALSGALGGPQQDLEDLQSLGPLGVHSVTCCTLSPIFMHSLGDVWHLGSEDLESLQLLGPSLQDLQDLQSLGPLGVHSVICCTLSSYLYAFLRWRLASWLWGSGVSAASGCLSARSGGSAVSGALGGPQCHLLHSFFLSLCIP